MTKTKNAEITRLRAEVKLLNQEIEDLTSEHLRRERDEALKEVERLIGELREAEQEIAVLGPSGKCLLCSERERERDEALDRLQRAEAVVEALDCKNVFSGKPGSPKVDWYEDGIFNEKRLYAALGKEDARTVLGIWRRFKNAALAAWEEGTGRESSQPGHD